MKNGKMKLELRPDTVNSDAFHVGIELELKISGSSETSHDDDACMDAYRDNLSDQSSRTILMDDFGLSRDEATNLEDYFNRDAWIDSRLDGWSCDDSDCCYNRNDSEEARDELCRKLKNLTNNKSFKVISDSSISTNGDEIDAEVCWNYFASRETFKDNAKIVALLKEENASFDSSCGLHINLNNYLKIPEIVIPTDSLAFLFDFVGASRRKSTYCNKYGMNHGEKYSMIYNQGDRLEFRFFSPTLEAVKLNHYVSLANVVYRRLAGKNAKLSKRTTAYFLNKMIMVNGLTTERAQLAIDSVNGILPAASYAVKEVITENEFDREVTSISAAPIQRPLMPEVSSIDVLTQCMTEMRDRLNSEASEEIEEAV